MTRADPATVTDQQNKWSITSTNVVTQCLYSDNADECVSEKCNRLIGERTAPLDREPVRGHHLGSRYRGQDYVRKVWGEDN